MKTKHVTVASLRLDPEIEKYIHQRDAELKILAARIAVHFAEHKPSRPLSVGDSLQHYTGELKAGYEQTGLNSFLISPTGMPTAPML